MRAMLILLVVALVLAASPAPRPAAPPVVVFTGVHVVPMDTERVLDDQSVVVRGDRILAVGPRATTPIPPGATRIEGRDRWIMPGLVDMHVHFNDPDDAALYVANGV